jgi:uncharacterized membrane protein YkoI
MGRLILLVCGLVLLHATVNADDDHDRVLQLRQAGEILPLEKILAISRERVQGKVIEVELEQKRNILIYELEILDATNRVWDVEIDATRGTVLKVKED